MQSDPPDIRSYQDLKAWQLAFRLGIDIYGATYSFPIEERYGLKSQMRRSAISIASNIAEGYGRGSLTDYKRFLRVARGSLLELETQCLFATELGLLSDDRFRALEEQSHEVGRVLGGLIRSLRD